MCQGWGESSVELQTCWLTAYLRDLGKLTGHNRGNAGFSSLSDIRWWKNWCVKLWRWWYRTLSLLLFTKLDLHIGIWESPPPLLHPSKQLAQPPLREVRCNRPLTAWQCTATSEKPKRTRSMRSNECRTLAMTTAESHFLTGTVSEGRYWWRTKWFYFHKALDE